MEQGIDNAIHLMLTNGATIDWIRFVLQFMDVMDLGYFFILLIPYHYCKLTGTFQFEISLALSAKLLYFPRSQSFIVFMKSESN